MGNTLGGVNGSTLNLQSAKEYITNDEFRRMQEAFNSFKKDTLSYEDFCVHVLGGAPIPEEQRHLLFQFCSRGSENLSFENLLSSLVGLCKIESVQEEFIENHKEFVAWGLGHFPRLTIPMKDEFISFYEVMSYVTHPAEVIELEKVFATISDRQVCKISFESWENTLSNCYPKDFSKRLFSVFDENADGFIDFREVVCGVSTLCRAPRPSRLSFLAKLWDFDRDGYLCDSELAALFADLNVKENQREISKSAGNKAAVVDVAAWALSNDYLNKHIEMAEEIGHICLGLKPMDVSIEMNTVKGFVNRTKNIVVSERNIVSSLWFRQWDQAVSNGQHSPPIDNTPLKGSKDDETRKWHDRKVACISPESSSLKIGLNPTEYIAVPTPLWKAWLRWHGSALPVDSQFTRKYLDGNFFENGAAGLELYPLEIVFVGHDRKKKDQEGVQQLAPWACAQVSRSMTLNELLILCKNQLRLKETDCRLWLCSRDQNPPEENFTLLDEDSITLHQLKLNNRGINKFLLEIRDPSTGVWPEELRASVTGTQIKSIGNTASARPGAVGIVNGGNFCYRNAAVQCLARVSPLTEFLLNDENVSTISKRVVENGRSVTTTLEYAALLKELWAGKKKNISPTAFNNAVKTASDLFDCGQQHDCQEFVAFLIEMLHNCMHKPEMEKPKRLEGEEPNENEKAELEWKNYLSREDSLVTSLFGGFFPTFLDKFQANCDLYSPAVPATIPRRFSSHLLPLVCRLDSTIQTSSKSSVGRFVSVQYLTVIQLDGSIPHRYGFLVSRETSIGHFRGLIADATKLDAERMTLQCFRRRKTDPVRLKHFQNFLQYDYDEEDAQKLCDFPAGVRMYAMEIPAADSWRLAAHRKLQYNYRPYLLGATGGCIASRFGLPLILACPKGVSGKQLYEDVMRQMQRFMVTPPPAFSNRASDPCEVSSSGYPFTLSIVDKKWEWCGQCDALRFCRGCPITSSDETTFIPKDCAIAVDWLPIALYLKYNHSQELILVDDPSVMETMNRFAAPSTLEDCLRKFSCAENLEELLFCETCKRKTNRSKSMSVWRLPKYLIIHFKRFEYLQAERRMGKCKRVIDFPLNNFDMSQFVNRPQGEKYDCIAMASHYGELSSGHFLAYARGKDEKWLLLNDCSVKEVPEEEVDKANAYLLFYESH